mmetsp:Transcript_7732/g.16977  ORF Transcript_7732/g.16977 Transcript_7732/m.16977 type:complete len:975 (+) Transcript_7732:211-3135(+)
MWRRGLLAGLLVTMVRKAECNKRVHIGNGIQSSRRPGRGMGTVRASDGSSQLRLSKLAQHLIAQNAPRAAEQLLKRASVQSGASAEEIFHRNPSAESATSSAQNLFTVAASDFEVVSDLESARAFSLAASSATLLALDAEWKPDTVQSNNPPSLLQLAIPSSHSSKDASGDSPLVWLVDLDCLCRPASETVDAALCAAFRSPDVVVLGFSFKADFEKLRALSARGWACGIKPVRRVIDLREACDAAEGPTRTAGVSIGLAAQLQKWTGQSLDKHEQTSDWSRRPLSARQLSYAAADAACLVTLHDALRAARPDVIVEREVWPSLSMSSSMSMSMSTAAAAAATATADTDLDLDACACAGAAALRRGQANFRAGSTNANAAASADACEGASAAVAAVSDRASLSTEHDSRSDIAIRQADLEARATAIVLRAVASLIDERDASCRFEVESNAGTQTHGSVLVEKAAGSDAQQGEVEVNSLCVIVDPPSSATRLAGAGSDGGVVCDDDDSRVDSHVDSHVDSESARTLRKSVRAIATRGACVLLLVPSTERLDMRWLANVLGVPRRRVRLASLAECTRDFNAVVGYVPPIPLCRNVRVLAMPQLARASRLRASAGGGGRSILISAPQTALPAICACAASLVASEVHDLSKDRGDCLETGEKNLLQGGVDISDVPGHNSAQSMSGTRGEAESEIAMFAWLPSPSLAFRTLDEAILRYRSQMECALRRANANGPGDAVQTSPINDGAERGGVTASATDGIGTDMRTRAGEIFELEMQERSQDAALSDGPRFGSRTLPPPPPPRLILDCSLATLSRKLRMVGIDAKVAGEVVRRDIDANNPRPHLVNGLMRVKVDSTIVETQLRQAAARGRLIITKASASNLPGVSYRLLASDPDEQFSELIEVFGLHEYVQSGESRCGICNARKWATLTPQQVVGRVSAAVVACTDEFYECGSCKQLFWPGEKYEYTMAGLRKAVDGAA